ncbi:unnamed protein product [Discosporangium mesarthrocarpum]
MTGAPAAMKVEGEGPHARGHVVTATQNCRSDFLRRVALAAPLGLITATASLQRDAAIADEGSTPASAPTFRNRVTTDTEQGVTSQGGGGEWKEPRVTQKGFMDISVGEAPAERLVISVHTESLPHPQHGQPPRFSIPAVRGQDTRNSEEFCLPAVRGK